MVNGGAAVTIALKSPYLPPHPRPRPISVTWCQVLSSELTIKSPVHNCQRSDILASGTLEAAVWFVRLRAQSQKASTRCGEPRQCPCRSRCTSTLTGLLPSARIEASNKYTRSFSFSLSVCCKRWTRPFPHPSYLPILGF
jgi:hypothetical protein